MVSVGQCGGWWRVRGKDGRRCWRVVACHWGHGEGEADVADESGDNPVIRALGRSGSGGRAWRGFLSRTGGEGGRGGADADPWTSQGSVMGFRLYHGLHLITQDSRGIILRKLPSSYTKRCFKTVHTTLLIGAIK